MVMKKVVNNELKKKLNLKRQSSSGYDIAQWSTSGRELTLIRPMRTRERPVPPEANRSKNTNRVPSFEDLYKAASERTRSLKFSQKEVLVMFYVGIDWATDHHNIFIADESGAKIDSFCIPHNPKGMSLLRDKLRNLLTPKEQILIAIETPRNLLVEFLLNEGYTIYPINPKSVDRYRDRYRPSGARDDSFDAMVLANIIRTDRDQFRAILPNSALARELKILTQDEQHLIRLKTRLVNQIQACLKDYWPTALELFSEIDQAVTLDFLLKYPRPEIIPLAELKKFLQKHHYPLSEEKAKEIHKKLSRPQIFVEDFTIRAKSRLLITLVGQLEALITQLDEYQREIVKLFNEHPDCSVFKSLPGSGPKNGPRLLAEMGDNRQRYSKAKNAQCEAGTSPITDASGKSKIVRMRYSCRKPFRNVLYQFAFSSLRESAWAKKFYDTQRDKGNTHTEALRALGNKWLKIIFRLWKDGTTYNEDRHLASIMRYQFNRCSAT